MSSLIEPQSPEPPPNVKPALQRLPRGPIIAKFHDRAKPHRVLKRTSVPPIALKNSKPWPGSGSASKSTGTADELIKHMSNVPSYLQTTPHPNGDDIQGKALNVGVLQWGALERYTGRKHSVKAASPLSPQSSTATTKQQQQQPTNCSRDFDPGQSSSFMHYRRSIPQSQSKYKNGTTNGEERCPGMGREGNKCFASNGSPVCGGQIKKNQMEFSGELFSDIQVKDRCTRVPYSCPLPRQDSDICTTTRCSTSSSNSSSVLRENVDAVSWIFTSHKQNTDELDLNSSLAKPPPVSTRGKMSNAEAIEREAASSIRGRQSPLRRMLDPFLKTRNAVSASHHELTPARLHRPLASSFSFSSKKKECHTGPHTCTEGTSSITTPSFQPHCNANLHLQQAEKIIQPLTRQALLQIAWKRGLPVFMLSSGESDILGATLRKKCISESTDYSEFSYSIFTLQESKMKGSAVWIRSGSKGKKQHLASNIVGEVRVSTSKSKCRDNSELYHVSREFVLVGPELVPVANTESSIHELKTEYPVNMELAAIVTSLPTNGCLCGKAATAGSVTAILPSGIHGVSARGEPSPLIERWRSGGGCDCGGWDEGCRLSLLSLEFNSEGSKSYWEETQARFELFPQVTAFD
jgi:Domain of unknown function (DUF3527)